MHLFFKSSTVLKPSNIIQTIIIYVGLLQNFKTKNISLNYYTLNICKETTFVHYYSHIWQIMTFMNYLTEKYYFKYPYRVKIWVIIGMQKFSTELGKSYWELYVYSYKSYPLKFIILYFNIINVVSNCCYLHFRKQHFWHATASWLVLFNTFVGVEMGW